MNSYPNYCQIIQEMQTKLKNQAALYFKSCTDQEVAHTQSSERNNLSRFYLLLIAQYLQSKGLSAKILLFNSTRVIDWEIFLQSVWAYTLGISENSQSFKELAAFIAEIDRKSLVDRNLIMTILPENLIDVAGIAKKQMLQKEARGAYTKFFYDQNKHNLFRQSNQGFAKLSLLLATLNNNFNNEIVEQKIISLIGNYDLDPDRVLDLIIQSFSQSENTAIHFYLISKFKPDSIATLLGNRILQESKTDISQKIVYLGNFQNFLTTNIDEVYRTQGFIVNPKLIRLAAMLIKRSIISLQNIFPFLNPNDRILQTIQSQKIEYGKEKIATAFKINLQQINEQDRLKQKKQDQLKLFGQLIYSSKLALFAELVRQNDWEHFKLIWNIYEDKIQLLTYQPLLHALYDILQWAISPLYDKISLAKFFKKKQQNNVKEFQHLPALQSQQLEQFSQLNSYAFDVLDQLFKIISQYIGLHSELFIKICRLFKKIIKQPEMFSMNPTTEFEQLTKNKIKFYLYEYLVPGICYQVQNPVVANEAYQVLECFEYQFRYSCYAKIYKETMVKNPYQAFLFEKTKGKQNIIANNLSEQNKKMFIKKMAKLTHNQSLHAFYWIFRRLMMEDYEATISQIVNALSGCNPITLQCAMFVILHCLTTQKQPAMNFKNGQQSSWFKNLTTFTSLFFRKYLETDMRPIFDFIIMKLSQPVQQLEDDQQLPGAPLIILKSLLNKMFGSFMVQDVNKNKYQILCAGQLMQFEALYLTSQIKAARKSKVTLENFFWDSVKDGEGSLSFNLLILLTRKRSEFLHRTFLGDIKIIGNIYDRFSSSIIQVIRFLTYQATDYIKYEKLLPKNALDVLVNQYKLPLEICFEIVRPSIKNISFMNEIQYEAFSSDIEQVIHKYMTSQNKFIEGYQVPQKLKNYLRENFMKIQKTMPKTFFTTFWFLTLDSIYFPAKLYSDKIEELKKKIQTKMPSKRTSDRDQKQFTKAKSLFEKLTQEEEQQKKKNRETMSPQNLKRLHLQFLKNSPTEKGSDPIQQFAEMFVQICLLPRILLDSSQALYCFKFTIEMIRANSSTSSKNIIRLLTFIIQYVMNYLPFATEREAANCLSVFLAQILGIFINWNDMNKLKADMNKYLGMDEQVIKDRYPKLKEYLLKLYERVGNLIKTIKDQPYNIKNCLYLLEKVDSIPGYKQQAEELQAHMRELKEQFTTLDMQTILQRQISMLALKKNNLPEKIQEPSKRRQGSTDSISNSQSKKDKIKSPQIPISKKNDSQRAPSTSKEKLKLPTNNIADNQPKTDDKKWSKKYRQKSSEMKGESQQKKNKPSQMKKESIIHKQAQKSPSTYKKKDQFYQRQNQPIQVEVKMGLEPQKPSTKIGDRKIQLQFKKQSCDTYQRPENTEPDRIRTVKELKNQIAKKNDDSIQASKQKDMNEKIKMQNKNQTLAWNQKGQEPPYQENVSSHRKNRQSIEIQINPKPQTSKRNQQRDQQNRHRDKEEEKYKYRGSKNKEDLPKQEKYQEVKPQQASNRQQMKKESIQKDQEKLLSKPQSQKKIYKQNLIESNKPQQNQSNPKIQDKKIQEDQKGNKNLSIHSSYQEQINIQNRGEGTQAYRKEHMEYPKEEKVQWKKNYRPEKYNQNPKRENYNKRDQRDLDRDYRERTQRDRERDKSSKGRGERERERQRQRDKEKSKSRDRYPKWKGREEYREHHQDHHHKDSRDRDRNRKRQERYQRDKRHENKSSKPQKDRERHY